MWFFVAVCVLIGLALRERIVDAVFGPPTGGGTGRAPVTMQGAPGPRPAAPDRQAVAAAARGTARRGFQEDLTFGDPQARRLRSALVAGDWMSVHAALDKVRDWDERAFLIDAITETVSPAMERTLGAWVQAKPDDGLPLVARGRWRIYAAWAARGGGGASSVTDEGWKVFFQQLQLAEKDFEAASELAPSDPTPHAYRVITARGLQLDDQEERARFDEARTRDPTNRVAHLMMMVALCQKWGGSHAAMFAFAREASAGAKEGSLLHGLVASAHIERWLWATSFADKAEDDPEWYGKAAGYFKDGEVKRELQAAWSRSLGSAAFKATSPSNYTRNTFAWCFVQMEDWDRAKKELEALGGKITELPWRFSARDPLAAVNEARGRVGLPAV